MDPTNRLRIATRIHFALLRQYGEHVPVSALLDGDAQAQEALWVCDASGDEELAGLARALRRAPKVTVRMPALAPGAEPQAMPWGQDTSGFGLSMPAPLAEAPVPCAKPKGTRWFEPPRWLRPGPDTTAR